MHPAHKISLLSLKEASEKLGVSIDTLLQWNNYNILKPTITLEGEIGYTQHQLDHFLTIRQSLQGEMQPTQLQQVEALEKTVVVHTPPQIEKTPSVAPSQSSNETASKDRTKPFSSLLIIGFAGLFVILTAAVLPNPGGVTSKMRLAGDSLASLPIQLQSERQDLRNEGEDIFKKKLAAVALYEGKPDKNLVNNGIRATVTPPWRQSSEEKALLAAIDADTTDGLSSISFSETTTDENSALDERGNIRGVAKTDTLSSIVEGIDEMVRSDSFNKVNTDMTSQVIFFSIGMLAVFFVIQRQFAYPLRKSPAIRIEPYPASITHTHHKVLEVNQKTDGSVVVYFQDKEYKISKPELNSESDQFIERLMTLTQSDVKEIEYDMIHTDGTRFITPFSRLVTRLGFVGLKRDLFFPRTSKTSVLFRKYLTDADLTSLHLTTEQILADLCGATN